MIPTLMWRRAYEVVVSSEGKLHEYQQLLNKERYVLLFYLVR